MSTAQGTFTAPIWPSDPEEFGKRGASCWDLYAGTYVEPVALAEDVVNETAETTFSANYLGEAASRPWSKHSLTTSVAKLVSRLRMLQGLGIGRRGMARAANKESVDFAIAFVGLSSLPNLLIATLDDDGSAVMEFGSQNGEFFADITFKDNDVIECYRRKLGKSSASCEGKLNEDKVRNFLRDEIEIGI